MSARPAASIPRWTRPALLAVALAVAALPHAVAAGAGSDLRIEVRDRGATGPPSLSWRVSCAPAAGSLPDPAAACRALRAGRAARLLETRPCPTAGADEYSGPETLTVRGRLAGRPVALTLNRTTTCQTGRWEDVTRLLGLPVAPWAPA